MNFKEKNLKKLQWYEEELLMWKNRFEILDFTISLDEAFKNRLEICFKIIKDCREHINKHEEMRKCSVLSILIAEQILGKTIEIFKASAEFAVKKLEEIEESNDGFENFKNKLKV